MSDRLISADKLKDVISDTWILDRIDEQPTVDAVPVIRCKDCKYSEPSVYPQDVNCTVLSKIIKEWAATDLIMTVFEDHYCGWGERREDE